MLYGIGVDTTQISRIEKSLLNAHFLEKCFGEQERQLFTQKNNMLQSIAANFAAKEALSKALGTGLLFFALNEAQILRNDNGAPFFVFDGKLKELIEENSLKAKVSLTHEGGLATAFVILERE